jgi:hypothetical protein
MTQDYIMHGAFGRHEGKQKSIEGFRGNNKRKDTASKV